MFKFFNKNFFSIFSKKKLNISHVIKLEFSLITKWYSITKWLYIDDGKYKIKTI